MKYFQKYGLLFLLLFSASRLPGQNKVQVVTKTVEKHFSYKPGETIFLQGEKAIIRVRGGNSKEVKVILKLISKAPKVETARESMAYQHYIMAKEKETIHLKNYFVIPRGKSEIQAILLAEYDVWVPVESTVKITNSYGNCSISNKQGNTGVDTRFGNITLEQVTGTGFYKNYFGDFTAKNIAGQITCRFNHTRTSVEGLSGSAVFSSTLGDITLSGLSSLVSLKIEATKSDINLTTGNTTTNQFLFTSEFGEIHLPENLSSLPQNQGAKKVTWEYGAHHLPEITAKTTFGKITLELE